VHERAWHGGAVSTTIQDQKLMPNQRRLGNDGTESAGPCKSDDGDDQINEKDDDVPHPGIVSKASRALGIQVIW
jgi:hypothetical protein